MKNKHEVIIKIEGEEWKNALDKAFNKKSQEVKVDGFRKGKIPRDIYEKKFGKESLYTDAIDFVIDNAFRRSLEESKLLPILQPLVDIKEVNENFASFSFTIITKPEIKIKKYKNLDVKKEKPKVTKEEVKQELDILRKQYAEIIVKDGKIEEGDTAVIDFEGFLSDVPFEGGKGENYPLEIGSKTFIPGFEEQLIGLKAQDEKDIKVTFPEEYPAENLKNQEVIFKVKVNEVKTKKIPEFNKDFFEDLQMENVNNEEELFSKVEKDLEAKKNMELENKFVDQLLEKIGEETEVEFPEELIESEVNRMLDQYSEKLKMQNITIEQYLEFTKSNIEELKNNLKKDAQKNVLYRNIIEEIKQLENIKVEDAEVQEEAEKLSKMYQMSKEDFIKAFGGLEMIQYDLEMRKTIEFLKNNN